MEISLKYQGNFFEESKKSSKYAGIKLDIIEIRFKRVRYNRNNICEERIRFDSPPPLPAQKIRSQVDLRCAYIAIERQGEI